MALERQYTTGVGWQTVEVGGGGASFPDEWTVTADGKLTISPTDGPDALWLIAPEGSSANFLNAWHLGQADEASVLIAALDGGVSLSLYEGVAGTSVSLNAGGGSNAIQVETDALGTVFAVGATGSLAIATGQDETQFSVVPGGTSEPAAQVSTTGDTSLPGVFFDAGAANAGVTVGPWDGNVAGGSGYLTLGASDDGATGSSRIAAYNDTGAEGVSITADVGTEPKQIWQSGGAARLTVSNGGYLVVQTTSAPADAVLAANECAVWFDSSNGAAKFMFKAKQADGTVKTGSVNVQT